MDKQYVFLEQASPFEYKVLTEQKNPSTNTWECTIEVPLQKLNYSNNNSRNYTTELMGPVIQSVQPLVNERHLVGEYGHPVFEAGVMPTSDQYIRRITTISPEKMSHMITKLWLDGEYVMGHVKTLHTTYGRDMTNFILLDRGTIGFSLRAVGGTKKVNGVDVVQPEGFVFITYDAVINPSNNVAKFNPNQMNMIQSSLTESSNYTQQLINDTENAVCVNGVCVLQESLHNPQAAKTALRFATRNKLLESFNRIKQSGTIDSRIY